MKIFRLPPLPNFLQRHADKLGASQSLGSAWGWLADLRDPLTRNNVGEITRVLSGSGLTSDQLRALALAAREASGEGQ